jgi:hypothetical protein
MFQTGGKNFMPYQLQFGMEAKEGGPISKNKECQKRKDKGLLFLN